jgi:hypothetical protein
MTFMPDRAAVTGPGTSDQPSPDPFLPLDQDFETVQHALVRGGLDRAEAREVGRETMVALWRWSAIHGPLGAAALADLATRIAGALREPGVTGASPPAVR